MLGADFVGDLGSTQGLLRFGSGLSEPHTGALRATLGFWPAVRGVLTPVAARTRIGLELLGEPRPSCVSGGDLHLDVDVRVWSEDSRLHWTLPALAELRQRPGQAPELVFYRSRRFASDAEFWRSSLTGGDLLGAPSAEVGLVTRHGREEARYIQGAAERAGRRAERAERRMAEVSRALLA